MCAIRSGKQSDPRQTVDRSRRTRFDFLGLAARRASPYVGTREPPATRHAPGSRRRLRDYASHLRAPFPRLATLRLPPLRPCPDSHQSRRPSRVRRVGTARCAMRAAGSQSSKLTRWTIFPRGGCTRACHTLRALASRPESVFLRRGRPGTAALCTSCGAAQSRCSSVHRAPAIFRALSAIPSRTLPKRCHV